MILSLIFPYYWKTFTFQKYHSNCVTETFSRNTFSLSERTFEVVFLSESCSKSEIYRIYRSSYRRYSIKIDVLKNFAKFTGKYLCQILFSTKLQALARVSFLIMLQALACHLIEKETLTQVFLSEVCEIFKGDLFT